MPNRSPVELTTSPASHVALNVNIGPVDNHINRNFLSLLNACASGPQRRTREAQGDIRDPFAMDRPQTICGEPGVGVGLKPSRPIRIQTSVTGFSSPWRSSSHHIVVVGRPSGNDVLKSDLRRNSRNEVRQRTKVHVKLSRASVEELNKEIVIGYTRMTDQEILREAERLIGGFGTYNVLTRNCTHFARGLIEAIMDTTIVEPDANAEYRFTQESVMVTERLFIDPSAKPGWILPKATTVVVNVTETTEPGTWWGKVQGSKECGKFLDHTVERVL